MDSCQIETAQNVSIRQTLLVEVPEDYQPTFSQVTTFNNKDVQTIKELYFKAKHKRNRKIIATLRFVRL